MCELEWCPVVAVIVTQFSILDCTNIFTPGAADLKETFGGEGVSGHCVSQKSEGNLVAAGRL